MLTHISYAPPGQEAPEDPGAVQRRDGDEVEDTEDDVDLEGEEQRCTRWSAVAPTLSACRSWMREVQDDGRRSTASTKLVTGPAAPTNTIPR